ncbi:RHS repeat-associated core domain-containing protein, partial [Rhodoferax sp.]|uniref:RHS repeat-associated core domain-containing protein n=1 Tax=Rhodoferax sp. TaxID=50421 RepID=UPI0027721255|nr:RHS repeat-associated core domain-containing protein [Rhodoferax sp.]
YLSEQPIAVIDTPDGVLLLNQELSAPTQLAKDAAFILKNLWRSVSGGGAEQWAWLHPNHLGAPEAATNAQGQVLWQASYQAFGAARVVGFAKASGSPGKTSFTLNLRLPGQYQDSETGLHYNRHRYYDPSRGEYLTPDPLGTPDGPNPYAYVRYNPLKYIDPEGLILFAFDGTGNTEGSVTNVVNFRDNYNGNDDLDSEILSKKVGDGARGYYIPGPGTDGIKWLDGFVAHTLRSRIDSQLAALDTHIKEKVRLTNEAGTPISKDNPVAIILDIVGFSRGSAAARDFANQVISRRDANYYRDKANGFSGDCVKVELRFMGLFDTVLSTHMGGFKLAIPEAVQYVSHAVARNEFRSLFPLESIEQEFGGPGFLGNRTERGFVGAHSDIGGGYNCADCAGPGRGDLSDVALNWMVAQAKAAGVGMLELPDDLKTVSNPVLHDETKVFPFFGPDREVRYPGASDSPGWEVNSREAPLQGISLAETETFIRRPACPGCPRNVAGAVDMVEYAKWLKANYGLTIAN